MNKWKFFWCLLAGSAISISEPTAAADKLDREVILKCFTYYLVMTELRDELDIDDFFWFEEASKWDDLLSQEIKESDDRQKMVEEYLPKIAEKFIEAATKGEDEYIKFKRSVEGECNKAWDSRS